MLLMLFLFINRFGYVYLSKVTFWGEGLNTWIKIWSTLKLKKNPYVIQFGV